MKKKNTLSMKFTSTDFCGMTEPAIYKCIKCDTQNTEIFPLAFIFFPLYLVLEKANHQGTCFLYFPALAIYM